MFGFKVLEEFKFIEPRFINLFHWKYSRIRTYLHQERIRITNHTSRSKLEALQKLKGKFSGPALLAATGPSLEYINPLVFDAFAEKGRLMAINDYILTSIGKEVTPNMYFLNDDPYWETPNKTKEYLEEIINNSPQAVCIFQPFYRKKVLEKANTVYYSGLTLPFTLKSCNPTIPNGLPNITIFHAISCLQFLGFSPIFLTGFDLTYIYSLSGTNGEVSLNSDSSVEGGNQLLATYRENVSDFLYSLAYQVYALKLFPKGLLKTLNEASYIDTIEIATESEVEALVNASSSISPEEFGHCDK